MDFGFHSHPYVCRFCKGSFDQSENLHKHVQQIHTPGPSSKTNRFCAICRLQCSSKESYRDHLEHIHGQTTEGQSIIFKSFTDFSYWKAELEKRIYCKYVQKHAPKSLSNNEKQYAYQCDGSDGSRKKKAANDTCHSILCAIESGRSGTVKVEYWSTHRGHYVPIEEDELDSAIGSIQTAEMLLMEVQNARSDDDYIVETTPVEETIFSKSISSNDTSQKKKLLASSGIFGSPSSPASRVSTPKPAVTYKKDTSKKTSMFSLASVACGKVAPPPKKKEEPPKIKEEPTTKVINWSSNETIVMSPANDTSIEDSSEKTNATKSSAPVAASTVSELANANTTPKKSGVNDPIRILPKLENASMPPNLLSQVSIGTRTVSSPSSTGSSTTVASTVTSTVASKVSQGTSLLRGVVPGTFINTVGGGPPITNAVCSTNPFGGQFIVLNTMQQSIGGQNLFLCPVGQTGSPLLLPAMSQPSSSSAGEQNITPQVENTTLKENAPPDKTTSNGLKRGPNPKTTRKAKKQKIKSAEFIETPPTSKKKSAEYIETPRTSKKTIAGKAKKSAIQSPAKVPQGVVTPTSLNSSKFIIGNMQGPLSILPPQDAGGPGPKTPVPINQSVINSLPPGTTFVNINNTLVPIKNSGAPLNPVPRTRMQNSRSIGRSPASPSTTYVVRGMRPPLGTPACRTVRHHLATVQYHSATTPLPGRFAVPTNALSCPTQVQKVKLSAEIKHNSSSISTGALSSVPISSAPAIKIPAYPLPIPQKGSTPQNAAPISSIPSKVAPLPVASDDKKAGSLFFESGGDMYILEPVDEVVDKDDKKGITTNDKSDNEAKKSKMSDDEENSENEDFPDDFDLNSSEEETKSTAGGEKQNDHTAISEDEKQVEKKGKSQSPLKKHNSEAIVSPETVSAVHRRVQLSHEDAEITKKVKYYQLEMKYLGCLEECKKLKIELATRKLKESVATDEKDVSLPIEEIIKNTEEALLQKNTEDSNCVTSKESEENCKDVILQDLIEISNDVSADIPCSEDNATAKKSIDASSVEPEENCSILIKAIDGNVQLKDSEESSNVIPIIGTDDSLIDFISQTEDTMETELTKKVKEEHVEMPSIEENVDIDAKQFTEGSMEVDSVNEKVTLESTEEFIDDVKMSNIEGNVIELVKQEVNAEPESEKDEKQNGDVSTKTLVKRLPPRLKTSDLFIMVRSSLLNNLKDEIKGLSEENRILYEELQSYRSNKLCPDMFGFEPDGIMEESATETILRSEDDILQDYVEDDC